MHLEISDTQLILSCCVLANIVQFLDSVTKTVFKEKNNAFKMKTSYNVYKS